MIPEFFIHNMHMSAPRKSRKRISRFPYANRVLVIGTDIRSYI